MSERVAGWYPDPGGDNRQRYWDGDSWTEYYQPLAPERHEVHGAATAQEDYPYLAQAGPRHDVMVAPGTPGSGWPASSAWGTPAEPTGDDTKVFTSGVRGTPGGMAAVVSITVLVIMAVVGAGWWLVAGRDTPDDGGPTGAPPSPTGGAPTGAITRGTVELGGTTAGTLDAGGSWVGDLHLDGDTTVMLDGRATDGTDLAIEVLDDADASMGGSDDRGRDLAELGGGSLDPLVFVTLPAGDYRVVVTEHQQQGAAFDLEATAITDELRLDAETTVDVPADGVWFGTFEVPLDGTYTVDVQDTEGNDPAATLVTAGGDLYVNDDRDYDGGDLDPLIAEHLPAGVQVLVLTEFSGSPTTVTVTVEQS